MHVQDTCAIIQIFTFKITFFFPNKDLLNSTIVKLSYHIYEVNGAVTFNKNIEFKIMVEYLWHQILSFKKLQQALIANNLGILSYIPIICVILHWNVEASSHVSVCYIPRPTTDSR